MGLRKEELSHFEDELKEEKMKIESNLRAYEKELDFGDDTESKDSFEEEADEAEEMANYLGVKETLDRRLKAIEAAIAKIDEGKYGVCEKCGGEIAPKVLEAEPESALCGKCKGEQK